MTCAETRRQLPEPEPAIVAQVEEHLALCPPCRVEQEALREVDRRIEQLGEHRLRMAGQVLDAVHRAAPRPLPLLLPEKSAPLSRLIGGAMIGVAVVFLALLAFFRLR
jgi:anti-sigma factor RsiW